MSYPNGAVVLIPSNRIDSLALTLRSLSACEGREVLQELVIVNNGPKENNARIACMAESIAPVTSVLHEPMAGLARSFNRGLDHICGRHPEDRLLLKVDDDVNFSPGWVGAMCDAAQGWGDVILGGRILPLFPSNNGLISRLPKESFSALFAEYDHGETAKIIKQAPFGPNMGWRVGMTGTVRCSHDLGLPNYMGDETELIKGIKAKENCSYVYVPNACVEHRIRPNQLSMSWITDRYFKFGRTYAALELRRKPAMTRSQLRRKQRLKQGKTCGCLFMASLMRLLLRRKKALWYRLKATRYQGETFECLQ